MPPSAPTALPPLRITAAGQTSDIFVGAGLLPTLGPRLRERTTSPAAILITDTTVGPLHAAGVRASLAAAGFRLIEHAFPAGEPHKHLETLLPAYASILGANIDRATPLIALGGGVVGDMAGFLAATLLRGIPFVQVPTTVMAMVDSAIGGKTGINHAAGKNLIGAFHQPILVLSDPELLLTLPVAEISNGLAECIKHDAIHDAAHFTQIPTMIAGALAKDIPALGQLVHRNAAIKSEFVNADPFERTVRAHLNFGHTFAHAFEIATDHALPHGAAVALGMLAAARLSQRLGILQPDEVHQLYSALQAARLPVAAPPLNPEHLITIMRRDKKVEAGKLRFVVLQGLGNPVVRSDVPEELVREVLEHPRSQS